ncbi:MAG: DNA/RNA nuclease SfsA [Magnetococcales bacterium]|nr:DNA/RNA nuclease SfsA [Magnetococcales bacterium]
MDFSTPLVSATFLRRYHRFLADFQAQDGTIMTAHCANTGSMMGLLHPGASAMLSRADHSKRKLAYTWELVHEHNSWVGIHTGRTNAIVREALERQGLPSLLAYQTIQSEVAVADKSRLDFRLDGDRLPPCFLEVKSVTLRQGNLAVFPDAVTERGRRHLEVLAQLKRNGARSVLLFVVQREDCHGFRPAGAIDPAYAATLRDVVQAGVEILVQGCRVGPGGITLHHPIPWDLA